MNLTPEILTPDQLEGLAYAASAYNAERRAAHAAEQDRLEDAHDNVQLALLAANPNHVEIPFVAAPFVPVSDEEYGRLRVAGMLTSYYQQSLATRASQAENQALIMGTLARAGKDPDVDAALAVLRQKTGV